MSTDVLITASLAILSGVMIYAIQKWFDRREIVRARHFQIHMEMVEAICGLANAHNRGGEGIEDVLSNYATAKMKFAIIASDDSMKHFVAFDRRISSGDKVSNVEFDNLLADYLRSVRIENLGKTRISNEDLVIVTPFGRSIRNGNKK